MRLASIAVAVSTQCEVSAHLLIQQASFRPTEQVWLGCGSPGVTLCRLGDDAEGVGRVDSAAFLGQVEVPVLIEVVVTDEGAELEDGFG